MSSLEERAAEYDKKFNWDAAHELKKLVVSTRDGGVRTGVTNNTVQDLIEVIDSYLADGYTCEDLIIEGITE